MRVQHHRDAGGRHRPRAQQAGCVLHRFLDYAGEVQLVHVAAVRKGKAGLHFGVSLGDRLQHAVGHRPLERRVQAAAVGDLDRAAAVAVDRVADPSHPGIEGGRPPLHLEREVDLPLRVGAGEPR